MNHVVSRPVGAGVAQETFADHRNALLDGLPAAVRERVGHRAASVALAPGVVLHEPAIRPRYCYFPTTAVVSLAYRMRSGVATEVAIVGHEGMVGAALVSGARTSPWFAIVQQGGAAVRIPVACLRDEWQRACGLSQALLCHALRLLDDTSRNAACNRLHSLDERLSRWLLSSQDRRANDADLYMTHEALSEVLGVRREAVSHAAVRLQRDRLIDCRRGHIRILDRAGLIAQACECYVPPARDMHRAGRRSAARRKTAADPNAMCAKAHRQASSTSSI